MKTSIFLVLFFYVAIGNAQKFPNFKPLRYDENYSFLIKDKDSANWYKKMKYLPVNANGNAYFSFGGDLRYQYFHADNEGWGEEPKDPDGYILSRLLLHSDFHIGKQFRAFLQIQSSQADGKISASPVDQNALDLHQAFIDFDLLGNKNEQLLIRTGRQEMSFGSQRLVAVRDGPNNRQSFDGIKLIYEGEQFRADAFYSHYVTARKGIFDDESLQSRKFWGSYLVFKNVPWVKNIDLYYFGYERDPAAFDEGNGNEKRHSAGTRIWGRSAGFRYDTEAVWQFGKFGSEDISAWTVSVNTGYRFPHIKFHPEIGLKGEFISGDRNYDDGKLQTFNPLFPRGAYFGLAALIGPSNLIDVHPSLSLELAKTLDWTIDYDLFWRYSINDGIYAPNVALIYSGKNSSSKNIGQQLSTDLVWNVNDFLYLRGEFTWFKAGRYLKDSGPGKDILFAGTTVQLKF
ncbi:MAG: alginate export family protein [Flavobacterium sp.]